MQCEKVAPAFTIRQVLPATVGAGGEGRNPMILNSAILTYAGFAVAYHIAFSVGFV